MLLQHDKAKNGSVEKKYHGV